LVLLVTGASGAGKSTVARRLSEWGHRAVSLDGDGHLCSWIDRHGRPVARPAAPDSAWLAAHRWTWDPTRLDEIIAEASAEGVETLWLCGQAANALDLAHRFDLCFLLEVDQRTMRERMTGPQRGNDFGRVGDTLQAVLASHTEFVAPWRRHGAVTIDATQDVDEVCEELLMAAALAALNLPRGSRRGV
jgi:adenylate kinase family enzyme